MTDSDQSVVNATDFSGATPLIKASFYVTRPNGPFLIALLLEKNADPTIEYSHGWCSAHILRQEDPDSELLAVMLKHFTKEKPFWPEKPRGKELSLLCILFVIDEILVEKLSTTSFFMSVGKEGWRTEFQKK